MESSRYVLLLSKSSWNPAGSCPRSCSKSLMCFWRVCSAYAATRRPSWCSPAPTWRRCCSRRRSRLRVAGGQRVGDPRGEGIPQQRRCAWFATYVIQMTACAIFGSEAVNHWFVGTRTLYDICYVVRM
ncbi:hypothetical protein BRADI_1g18702v3 [Brachypodium distachyon]|uniref:Uncharacterized protein n=1 Tax=Brachypodium distachyon TaxID=15368 RepID=A0A2K2DK05_BRADI|nr:hypothetical protein BRADI_1g18702v3 [Brachypodium distachyon]